MSGRKRHTEVLDFMRTFIVAERTGHWADLFGAGYGELIAKLIKRGWIKRDRSPAHDRMGSWHLNMQRRNSLRTTAKGRRAIYRIDRHSQPAIRPHSWATHHGFGSEWSMQHGHDRRLERLLRTSERAKDLHASRPRP